MNEFNHYIEFINSLDELFEEINSIISLLIQNGFGSAIAIQDTLLLLNLIDRLLACLNQDLQKIYYLVNK